MALEAVSLVPSCTVRCSASPQAPSLCGCSLFSAGSPWLLRLTASPVLHCPHQASLCAAASSSTAAQEGFSVFLEEEVEEGHASGLPLFHSYDPYDEDGDGQDDYRFGLDDDHVSLDQIERTESPEPVEGVDNGSAKMDSDDARRSSDDRYKLLHGREVFTERAYLVGIERKGIQSSFRFADSLSELAQLADTAGLEVVGSTYQKLDQPNPRTYIGSGKVAELRTEVRALEVETVIFDDELSPGQLRNLEKALGNEVRVCDRTALILDIFSQRAATREASLQVELAQMEYQLPRLSKLWSHLERQAGGMVKGMGEKQIEVDKRILRTRIALLRKELDSVRGHRQQYRDRRGSVPIPVVSLVGYTNAGKSTLLNRLSGADVLAEDRLFATLDPTTRKIELPNGNECLLTDTVGFIQKLPTQLVASFRATLEEINDSALLVHVVDISHPLAKEQIEAVNNVLAELNVGHIPRLTVWNKIDKVPLKYETAGKTGDVVCISAATGEGVDAFCKAIQEKLKDSMVWVDVLVPYAKGEFVNSVHRLGVVESMEYVEDGIALKAHVPLRLSRQLQPMRKTLA